MVTSNTECGLAWFICDTDEFIPSIAKLNQLASQVVTQHRRVVPKIPRRSQKRSSNLRLEDGTSVAEILKTRRAVPTVSLSFILDLLLAAIP